MSLFFQQQEEGAPLVRQREVGALLPRAKAISFAGNKSIANNSTVFIQTAAATNSYASYQPGGANSQEISFQTWNGTNERTPGMRLYVDPIVPGSGASTVVDIFTVSSSGALSFTAGNNPVGASQPLGTTRVVTNDNVLIGGFII